MSQDAKIPPDFAAICAPGERILWHARPLFWPYMSRSILVVLFGIAWGIMVLMTLHPVRAWEAGQFDLLRGGPDLVQLLPSWVCALHGIYTALAYLNTAYAYSNRRLLIRSGPMGAPIQSIDQGNIQDVEVTASLVERLFGAGTIRTYSGHTTRRGRRLYDAFAAVADPDAVFRALKQSGGGIKSDGGYPGAAHAVGRPG